MAYPVDSRQLRPRRRWYVVAVVIAVLFTAIGIGGFAIGVVTAAKSVPDFDGTYTGNQQSSVQLATGRTYALYVPVDSSQSCVVDDEVRTVNPPTTFSFTRGGREWVHLKNLTVVTTGSYDVNCSVPTYAIGPEPELGKLAGGIGGGIAALIGLPCIGITIGGIIALVTGLRRSSHKKRLNSLSAPTW
ncbi:hypothetical protein [Cryptosporangium sp. NPDC048952]|uniref:hypothetical protein n=1 Tax=Cryptosporangium sp. NPDC048952 TaxID=3363961 RepID=UPI0037190567